MYMNRAGHGQCRDGTPRWITAVVCTATGLTRVSTTWPPCSRRSVEVLDSQVASLSARSCLAAERTANAVSSVRVE